MATTPAGRVDSNTEVLVGHLSSLIESLTNPATPIPFFSINNLDNQELIRKARLEAQSYATLSEMETHRQLHMVTATTRAYNMSRQSRAAFFAAALLESQSELAGLQDDQLVSSRAIDQRTLAQRGRS